jgi:hypothetical protein
VVINNIFDFITQFFRYTGGTDGTADQDVALQILIFRLIQTLRYCDYTC